MFPNINDLKILHMKDKNVKLNVLESIEMFKANEIPVNK